MKDQRNRLTGIRAPLVLIALMFALHVIAPFIAPGTATAQETGAQTDQKISFQPIEGLNVDELRRMVQLARDAGMSKEQLGNITIEDIDGTTINALAYLEAYDAYMKAMKEKEMAESSKVYLTSKEIIDDLDQNNETEVKEIRDKLLWTN